MIHINEYAFVLDGDKPIVKPELDMLTVMTTEFTRVVIPCKPSHPLTEMYLTHDRVQVPNRFYFTHSLTHSLTYFSTIAHLRQNWMEPELNNFLLSSCISFDGVVRPYVYLFRDGVDGRNSKFYLL